MNTASSHGSDPLSAARRLRLTLTELADSLAHGRLERILDVEPRLAAAVAGINMAAQGSAARSLSGDAARELRTELVAARAALSRCTALGASLDDAVWARCSTGYGASGSGVADLLQPSIEGHA